MIDAPEDDAALTTRRRALEEAWTKWETERTKVALEEVSKAARALARTADAVAAFPTAHEIYRRKERAESAEGRP